MNISSENKRTELYSSLSELTNLFLRQVWKNENIIVQKKKYGQLFDQSDENATNPNYCKAGKRTIV
jgi:hypothetical protein